MQPDLIARPAIRYRGSKFRIAPWIISFFPPHTTYVEPYGGSASVLLNKTESKTEIYNDLDSEVVNFFRLLRCPNDRRELAAQVSLTPHSHNIENASNGFRTWGPNSKKNYAREWSGIAANLLQVAARFDSVVIEHLEARDIIAKYDGVETLFYVDPPYVRGLRDDRHKGYAHEMTDHEHCQLAWLLKGLKGKVVLSGYPGSLYGELYGAWRRAEKETTANGQNGSVARTEVLWMNYAPPAS